MELSAEQQKALEEQKQYCPFCKIVKGEIPSQKLYEDNEFLAILDINPAVQGHALLMPKEHYPVLPFVPDATRDRLATLLPQVTAAIERALMVTSTQAVIANGAAAGQQTSHFLIHLLPSDAGVVHPADALNEQRQNAVRSALSTRYADPKERLTRVLSQSPELRRMVVETPEALLRELPGQPDLARMFAGVDIQALSLALAEETPPVAARMEDAQLVRYIASKEKLRDLLLNDPGTLEMAIEAQPKLKVFFAGSTVEQVAARYRKVNG